MMNLLEAMRIFGAIVEHGGPSGAGFPFPEIPCHGDGASIAAPTTL
ncbi:MULTISPECIES: hypothetical protein [Burkholderia]|nr:MULTISPECIES: hypothetical protein [Burkholderia]